MVMVVMAAAGPVDMAVVVAMRVTMVVVMRVTVTMIVPVVLVIQRLRGRVVLFERRIVAVTMAAAIGARLRLERRLYMRDGHAQEYEHVFEHWIGFELQRIGADLHGCVAIAEVVGSTHQGEAVVARHTQDVLRCGLYFNQRAVFSDQHITAAHDGAARQHDGHVTAIVEGGAQAAAAALQEWEYQLGCALDQHGGQAVRRGEVFVDGEHGQYSFMILRGGPSLVSPPAGGDSLSLSCQRK